MKCGRLWILKQDDQALHCPKADIKSLNVSAEGLQSATDSSRSHDPRVKDPEVKRICGINKYIWHFIQQLCADVSSRFLKVQDIDHVCPPFTDEQRADTVNMAAGERRQRVVCTEEDEGEDKEDRKENE